MPIVQGTGAFSVGRDCQVVLIHPLAPGGRVDIPNVTGFDAKQVTANVKMDRLDGVQLAAELPKGWTFDFECDRGNSGLDDLCAAIEAAWYLGGTVQPCSVYQYIAEPNGGTSTYEYTQASLKFDPGSWRGDAIVKQKIMGEAFRRNKV